MTQGSVLPLLHLKADQVWIWADLHLHEEQADEIQNFSDQIRSVVDDVEAVIVLGDLFDAWVGREMWTYPAFQPLVEAFAELQQRQIRLILLRGNRDVLMNPPDVQAVGAVLADRVLLQSTTDEPPMLLSHGDEYCLNDHPYQRLRRTLRRRPIRAMLRLLPHGIRRRIAAKMRGHSQRAVGRKPMDMMALDEGAVERALEEVGAGRAVIGHLHQERRQKLAGGGFLHVLPAWEPSAAAWRAADEKRLAEDVGNA